MAEIKNDFKNQEKEDFLKISLVNQGAPQKKDRTSSLENTPYSKINYKNLILLKEYLSERGKISSSRITGVCLKKQRRLAKAIKRARNLALLSFISKTEA